MFLNKEVVAEFEVFKDAILPPIRWSRKPLRSRFGICIRTIDNKYSIGINKLLCSLEVPVEVVKYLIYHEMLHANGYWNHNEDFRSYEWNYPKLEEWDGFLDQMAEKFKLDFVFSLKEKKMIKHERNSKNFNDKENMFQFKVERKYATSVGVNTIVVGKVVCGSIKDGDAVKVNDKNANVLTISNSKNGNVQAEDKAIRMILTDIREEDIAVGDIIYKQ